MNEGTCIHYVGVFSNKCCDAGVNYEDTFGKEAGIFLRLPCMQYNVRPAHGRGTYIKPGEPTVRTDVERRGQAMIPCTLLQLPTPEQVLQNQMESEASLAKIMAALKIAGEWRIKPKPQQDRREIVECPICKGRLHLSQSSYNGHVHGKCETENCVSWME